MLRMPVSPLAAIVVLGLALTGCQRVQDETAACPISPPPKLEQAPPAPVANYEQIWQPGHWDWNGTGYTWREGAWIKREGHSNQWMDGYWARDKTPGPCGYVPAHWM